mmetsp:Transcript_31756/g.39509  ORF Transcript_31756/g.39509 Transcript_31756/m.39509 type:complete len:139 (+) Transcript_31756:280-696(+)
MQRADIQDFDNETLVEMIMKFKTTQNTIKKHFRMERDNYNKYKSDKEAELAQARKANKEMQARIDALNKKKQDWQAAHNKLIDAQKSQKSAQSAGDTAVTMSVEEKKELAALRIENDSLKTQVRQRWTQLEDQVHSYD